MLTMPKVKRTYNLSERTVVRVREISERYGLGRSQDGVVELAVEELERQLRCAEEATAWAAAAADPVFKEETADLESAFELAERETWPA
jgi:hypothetical protein